MSVILDVFVYSCYVCVVSGLIIKLWFDLRGSTVPTITKLYENLFGGTVDVSYELYLVVPLVKVGLVDT
jgi:hypothetical protein